ncbi:uncharacterized protein PD653_4024 [Nocardioides sp. PD653]|nr:uncharacterized protein PD653B2_2000 [Nocardioides sp. PD653-B2]GAW56587.1 uncharacterized protein PD653_4024 [Nocardioides sp. PD653]
MAIGNQLTELVAAARKDGWASGTGKLEVLRVQAQWLELTPMASRRGQSRVDVLRPVDPGDAPRRSLSATYGSGAQPLHTDGAHLSSPPDIVILSAESPSPVPTMLWRGDHWRTPYEVRENLAHGLFIVDDGTARFLAPAFGSGRYRFDPGCMRPADSRARRAFAYFEEALASAIAFNWTEPDQVLVLDNRAVLHARADAAATPERELKRLMFRVKKVERR